MAMRELSCKGLGKGGLGIAGIVLGSLIWGWLFQNIDFLQKIDTAAYRDIFLGPHHPLIALLAQPFNYNLFFHIPFIPEDLPTFFYFLILGVGMYLWFKDRGNLKWFLACVIVGNLLVHTITLLSSELLFRERPFLVLNLPLESRDFNAWRYLSSYPSGHARDTALYATIIALFVPSLKWPARILIAFIAFTRVYLGAHYPSDVVAGVLIGSGIAYILWKVCQALELGRKDV